MYCRHCGAPMNPNFIFCERCGQPVNPGVQRVVSNPVNPGVQRVISNPVNSRPIPSTPVPRAPVKEPNIITSIAVDCKNFISRHVAGLAIFESVLAMLLILFIAFFELFGN